MSAPGRLEFHREPVVDRRSQRFGIRERVFRLQPRQIGTFRAPQHLADAIVHGIRRTLTDLLADDETIDDRDRVYISMASDRLEHAYYFQGSTAGEWRQDRGRAAVILDQLAKTLNSNQQFEMNDLFNCPLFMSVVRLWALERRKYTYLATSLPKDSRP